MPLSMPAMFLMLCFIWNRSPPPRPQLAACAYSFPYLFLHWHGPPGFRCKLWYPVLISEEPGRQRSGMQRQRCSRPAFVSICFQLRSPGGGSGTAAMRSASICFHLFRCCGAGGQRGSAGHAFVSICLRAASPSSSGQCWACICFHLFLCCGSRRQRGKAFALALPCDKKNRAAVEVCTASWSAVCLRLSRVAGTRGR